MWIITADTPEEIRAEILKYVAWLKNCETINEKSATMERDKRAARYAKNLLTSMESDLKDVRIVPKESDAVGRAFVPVK